MKPVVPPWRSTSWFDAQTAKIVCLTGYCHRLYDPRCARYTFEMKIAQVDLFVVFTSLSGYFYVICRTFAKFCGNKLFVGICTPNDAIFLARLSVFFLKLLHLHVTSRFYILDEFPCVQYWATSVRRFG